MLSSSRLKRRDFVHGRPLCDIELPERLSSKIQDSTIDDELIRKLCGERRSTQDPDDAKSLPDKRIVEYWARVGLEKKVFAYLSRFGRFNPEQMALSFEFLQKIPLDGTLSHRSEMPSGIQAGCKLNFFRLAQRIRDEHSTTRKSPTSCCFRSFQEVIELERRIDGNHCVEFIVQCLTLKLVDWRHVPHLFESTSSLSQLEALQTALVRYPDVWHLSQHSYAKRFGELKRRELRRSLSWKELQKFLKTINCLVPEDAEFLTEEVLVENPDEALNCLLNIMHLIFGSEGFPTDNFVRILKLLLKKGASWYFRDSDDECSSLTAFVSHVKLVPIRSLSEVLPLICCPLDPDGRSCHKLNFDNYLVAPLSCLAARRIRPSCNEAELPVKLRPFVKTHQELQAFFKPYERN